MGEIAKRLHRKLASKSHQLPTNAPKRRPGEPLPSGAMSRGRSTTAWAKGMASQPSSSPGTAMTKWKQPKGVDGWSSMGIN